MKSWGILRICIVRHVEHTLHHIKSNYFSCQYTHIHRAVPANHLLDKLCFQIVSIYLYPIWPASCQSVEGQDILKFKTCWSALAWSQLQPQPLDFLFVFLSFFLSWISKKWSKIHASCELLSLHRKIKLTK